MDHLTQQSDPDRFFQFEGPGSQEWWYFDAVSSDGRDVLVIVWYAGLPFDPKYGVASLRHLKNPKMSPKPNPLDHSAIGFQWHRDGKLMAYALNAFPARYFVHQAVPFTIDIAGNRLVRDTEGYHLVVSTPCVDGRTPILAEMRFRPASRTQSFERDFGSSGRAHHWILVASDCTVEGQIQIGTNTSLFQGRGYHDHNAGNIEISQAIHRWEWGRVHRGATTDVFYLAEPQTGPSHSLWITCRDGAPEKVRKDLDVVGKGPVRNVFGMKSMSVSTIFSENGEHRELMQQTPRVCLDDGPFYRRWTTMFKSTEYQSRLNLTEMESLGNDPDLTQGISELLDTKNLNRRLFNWMIPYRLKRPLG